MGICYLLTIKIGPFSLGHISVSTIVVLYSSFPYKYVFRKIGCRMDLSYFPFIWLVLDFGPFVKIGQWPFSSPGCELSWMPWMYPSEMKWLLIVFNLVNIFPQSQGFVEKVLYVQVLRKTFPEGQRFDFLLIKCFPRCDLKIVLLSVTAEGQKLAGSESSKELFNFKVTRYVYSF